LPGYTKLFSSITESSIWCESNAVLRVWIGLLARADADGVVEGSVPGFASLCRVSIPEMEEALTKLAAPDPHSRSREHEGRRIEVFDGGWVILNYAKYRKRAQAKEGSRAPYYREYRERKRAELFRESGAEREPGEDG